MTLLQHALLALRAFASQRWHGKGCRRSNCGTVCLCGPCHARVALEKMAEEVHVSRAEQAIMTRALSPGGRWRVLTKTSPSGKTLFVCLSCGDVTPAPTKTCAEKVLAYDCAMRACKDWEPSPFEVQ